MQNIDNTLQLIEELKRRSSIASTQASNISALLTEGKIAAALAQDLDLTGLLQIFHRVVEVLESEWSHSSEPLPRVETLEDLNATVKVLQDKFLKDNVRRDAALERLAALQRVQGDQADVILEAATKAAIEMQSGDLSVETVFDAQAHPLAAAYALIFAPDSLDDEGWQQAEYLVAEAFSAQTRLAIVRTRLRGPHDLEPLALPHPRPLQKAPEGVVPSSLQSVVSGDDPPNPPLFHGEANLLSDKAQPQDPDGFVSIIPLAATGSNQFQTASQDSESAPNRFHDLKPPSEPPKPSTSTSASEELPLTSTPELRRQEPSPDSKIPVNQDEVEDARRPNPSLINVASSPLAVSVPSVSDEMTQTPNLQRVRQASSDTKTSNNTQEGVSGNIQALSSKILKALKNDQPTSLATLQWSLLLNRQPQLALALCALTPTATATEHIQESVLKVLLWGMALREQAGPISRELELELCKYDPDSWFGSVPDHDHPGIRLLLLAGCLVPSVLSGHTGTSGVLPDLRLGNGLEKTFEFVGDIVDLGSKLSLVDPTLLSAMREAATWDDKYSIFQKNLEDFLTEESRKKNRFQAATRVLHKWYADDGFLGGPLSEILRAPVPPEYSLIQRMEALAKSSRASLIKKVHETDRELRRSTNPIDGEALQNLVTAAERAMQRIIGWVSLCRARPSTGNTHAQNTLTKLKELVREQSDEVEREIDAYKLNLSTRAAVIYVKESLALLRDVFNTEKELDKEKSTGLAVHGSLLALAQIDFDDQWTLQNPRQAAFTILESLSNEGDLPSIFDVSLVRLTQGDLVGARLALDVLSPETRQKLEGSISRETQTWRQRLAHEVRETREHIEWALVSNLLPEDSRSRMMACVQSVEDDLEALDSARDLERVLKSVKDEVKNLHDEALKRNKKRLKQLKASIKTTLSAEEEERVKERMTAKDLTTLNEFLDMLERGQPLPAHQPKVDNALDTFLTSCDEIERALQQHGGIRRLRDALRDRKTFAGLHFARVPNYELKSAEDLLTRWSSLMEPRSHQEKDLEGLLSALGFENPKVHSLLRQPGSFHCTTTPLASRSRCPVPEFGSLANGNYAIIVLPGSPSEDDVVDRIKSSQSRLPFVFCMGVLPAKRRRDLAALAREQRARYLLLDSTMVAYLASIRGSRLTAFFQCALPYTVAQPYITTAGPVPLEMFYGRAAEIDDIWSPTGTCFIFGGRQLGKTALLREIERLFHKPNSGHLVIYTDLKAKGIGLDRRADDIWDVIGAPLKEHGVTRRTTREDLVKATREWLEQDVNRRILLLLDEADGFQEIDGEEAFKRTSALKDLMESTKRRFKVVFAGLHNVQRSTRQANHPLAHFGQPRCIGPLLGAADFKDARDMVCVPMESLGYRFENEALPIQILSQANYYPSLLQVFGRTIINHLTSQVSFDPNHSPPYTITQRHIDDVSRGKELRNQIRDKFDLTLQLDQRYEVIAYAIAHRVRQARAEGPGDADLLVHGLSISEVREEVFCWWPDGFAKSDSYDEIRDLLDELVGLGVLRHVEDKPGHFALRSSNVALLFGTDEEIEKRLLITREDPVLYDPSTFRSALGDSPDGRRSPLSARQDADIQNTRHGVSIIFGTTAGGLNDLRDHLALTRQDLHHAFIDAHTPETLIEHLRTLRHKHDDRRVLAIIPAECRWDYTWLNLATAFLDTLKTDKRILRVVFVADSELAWSLAKHTSLSSLSQDGIHTTSITTWSDAAIRRWIEELDISNLEDTQRKLLKSATGNWAVLLTRFLDITRHSNATFETRLETIEAELLGDIFREKWWNSFGLHNPDCRSTLAQMAHYEGFPFHEVRALPELASIDPDRVLRWGDMLGIIHIGEANCYSVDPIIAKLVSPGSQDA